MKLIFVVVAMWLILLFIVYAVMMLSYALVSWLADRLCAHINLPMPDALQADMLEVVWTRYIDEHRYGYVRDASRRYANEQVRKQRMAHEN